MSVSKPEAVVSPRVPLWRSGVYALGASVISIGLAVANSIVIARALGPSGKGSYDLALTTTALLSTMLGFSLPVGITYIVARGRANLHLLVRQLIGIAFLLALLTAAILYALQNTRFENYFVPEDAGNWIILLLVLTTGLMESVNYWRAILNGRQQIIQANRSDLISRTLHLVILLIVLGVITLNRQSAYFTQFLIINVAVLFLTNLIFLKVLRPALRPASSPSGLNAVMAYAFPCYLGNFIQFLNYRLDVFIVNYFAGQNSLGLYTLAVSLGQMIWLVSRSAAMVLLPNVAALQEAGTANAQRTAQITRLVFVVSIASALLLALIGAPLVPLIFGAEYRPSVLPLLWLLPGIVAFSAANVIASYLAGIGKPRLNLYVALAGLVVTIALDLLLIPIHGIVGAAIASTLSYTTSTVLIVWLFMRESGLRIRHVLLPTRHDLTLAFSLTRSLLQRRPSTGDR
jgi:O-antigen/teichoic acid export membrane protein